MELNWTSPRLARHILISRGDTISWHVACFEDTDKYKIRMSFLLGILHGQVKEIDNPQSLESDILDFVAKHECWLEQQIIFKRDGVA